MIMRWLFIFICNCTLFAAQNHYNYLTHSIGIFDIANSNDNEDVAALFGIEYTPNLVYYNFRPITGFFVTTDYSTYLHAGVSFEFLVLDKCLINPSVALGWYNSGRGKRLHYPLEFRSSIAISWIFDNFMRLGVMFYHLSNASIFHLNPGVEILTLFLSVPF